VDNELPSISILIPTLNAEKALVTCLESIKSQKYPKEKIEILVADGGSTDKTIETAKSYGAIVFGNPLKTGEAGKAVALKHAKNELVALIDSDNTLPDESWLTLMVEPFCDKEILGAEPWEFTYRKEDGYITRYCSLLGANDPYCHFTGVYDRRCQLTDLWTGLKIEQLEKSNYLEITLENQELPTIGANGTIWRREVLNDVLEEDYFFDIDIPTRLVEKLGKFKFAKVKTGIIHIYCGKDLKSFLKKQRRRIDDLFYHGSLGQRKYKWGKVNKKKALNFILPVTLSIPLFLQAAKGYRKSKDKAWFFHPLACWITLIVYSTGLLRFYIKGPKKPDRTGWKQST